MPRPPGARGKSLAEKLRSGDRPPVAHGYFRSFDGTRIFYSSEGKGLPLVFCYGLVCSSLHWTYQIEHFARLYRAIWFDYRGHANSEVPADLKSLTVETMARDLRALLDELGVERAVLLGHSMGVNTVLELYRQAPERVAGMVLANGTARQPLETLLGSNALQAGFRLLKRTYDFSPDLVQAFWKLQKGNPVARAAMAAVGFNPHLTPPEDVQLYLDQIADMDPRIFLSLIENYDTYDATSWLHTVRVPTLIFGGQNDLAIPIAQQELMHQLIPGSRLEIIRHGSHCPQMDLPELVNLKIEGFLRENGYAALAQSGLAAPGPDRAPVDAPVAADS
jgi:pimeloyl-ACP methyl ester carboxylesterase